jgi:peptidoglycan/LPS O-acetylase OafA/YrhL
MGILRFLLALSVVAAHGGAIWKFNFVGGQIAVQTFYIISGFYMSLIINEKYIGRNNSYKLFITNRFLRLYPIYWVVLLATIIACIGFTIVSNGHQFLKFDSYISFKTNICSLLFLILSNILIFGQDLVMFLGISPENGNLFFTSNFQNTPPPLYSFLFIPQAWSLGIELCFYLLAPFILKKGFKIVFLLICLSFLLRLFIYNVLGLCNDPWTFRFFPTEIMFFLFGYASYKIYLKIKVYKFNKLVYLSVLFFILAFVFFYLHLPSYAVKYLPFSLKDIFYFLTIILGIPFIFCFLKKNKYDDKIGELSYPIYISHLLVIIICFEFSGTLIKSGWFIVSITIIIAYLLNKLIAKPIDSYRQKRIKNNASL